MTSLESKILFLLAPDGTEEEMVILTERREILVLALVR